jgi:hypothetical protein
VQAAALAAICPAVTIECGRTGATAGVDHAAEFVASALAVSDLPDHPLASSDIDLLRTSAIVKVPSEATMSFDGSNADFRFRADLDRLKLFRDRGRHLLRISGRQPPTSSLSIAG